MGKWEELWKNLTQFNTLTISGIARVAKKYKWTESRSMYLIKQEGTGTLL